MRTSLVRYGADAKLEKGGHCYIAVHTEMYLQILRDYPSLPPPEKMKAWRIRWYYEGLRRELQENTKPRGSR